MYGEILICQSAFLDCLRPREYGTNVHDEVQQKPSAKDITSTFEKQAFAAPLKDIAALLPDAFLLVHRSHLINLNHVVRFDKRARAYDVLLDDASEIPISRHRLGLVSPRLQAWNTSGRAIIM